MKLTCCPPDFLMVPLMAENEKLSITRAMPAICSSATGGNNIRAWFEQVQEARDYMRDWAPIMHSQHQFQSAKKLTTASLASRIREDGGGWCPLKWSGKKLLRSPPLLGTARRHSTTTGQSTYYLLNTFDAVRCRKATDIIRGRKNLKRRLIRKRPGRSGAAGGHWDLLEGSRRGDK